MSLDRAAAVRQAAWLVRVVDELGELAEGRAAATAQLLFDSSTQAGWPSVREVMLPVLRQVAGRGGPLWRETWLLIRPFLAVRGSRGGVLAAYAEQARADDSLAADGAFWVPFLCDDDAWARAVATAEIARLPSFEGREEHLLLAMLDPAHQTFAGMPSPASAGLALREVSIGREGLVGSLVAILESGRQMPAGGAALALRPGEAPVGDLLFALRGLHQAQRIAAVVVAVERLLDEPGARQWMEKHWPEGPAPAWEHRGIRHTFDGTLPPSEMVRRELVHAIAPGLAASEEAIPDFIALDADFLAGMAAAARYTPGTADPWLLRLTAAAAVSPSPPMLWPEAQEDLGAAASRIPELAEILVRWWDAGPRISSSFPGIALERLAERGHAEARRVYAAWLPANPFTQLLRGAWRPPSAAALATPDGGQAARTQCEAVWAQATDGWVDADGKRLHLAPEALGHLFRGLWPAWRGSAAEGGLLERALAESAQGHLGSWYEAAATAFVPAGAPPGLAQDLVARLADWRLSPPYARDCLAWALDLGLRGRLAPILQDMVANADDERMWRAAAALAAMGDEAGQKASVDVAERFPRRFSWHRLLDEHVAALVKAAPDPWLAAIQRVALGDGFWWADELFMVLEPLVNLARADFRARILVVLDTIDGWPQAWMPARGFRTVRPEDLALRLRHRLDDGP